MFKNIALLAAVSSISLCYGADSAINNITVQVGTMSSETHQISVNANTTILGVKQKLQNDHGIPVDKQNLHAVWPIWWKWSSDYSAALCDDCHVQEVVSNYNTTTFLALLQLRKNNNQ